MFRCCNCWDAISDPYDAPGPWTTGLCHCLQNPKNAILTALCPCVTYGQLKEILDQGQTSCFVAGLLYLLLMPLLYCQWTIARNNRRRLRRKFNLKAAPCGDACTHIFCPCCALCQEFRELKSNGLNPALGWEGIVAQQERERKANQQKTVPPTTQTMSM